MVTVAQRWSVPVWRSPDQHLLHDCLSLDAVPLQRPSALERLEAEVGRELAHRLLSSLTAHRHG